MRKVLFLAAALLCSLTSFSQAPCESPYDTPGNGTFEGAAYIPNNTDITGTLSWVEDLDCYVFYVVAGTFVRITLTNLPADYAFDVWGPPGPMAFSNNMGTDDEELAFVFPESGYYYVRVMGYDGAYSDTECYTLKVQQ
jgi:bacillolysin/thermolysin